jgi:hypothetical protein
MRLQKLSLLAVATLMLFMWLHSLPLNIHTPNQETEIGCGAPYPNCPWMDEGVKP